MQFDLPEEGPVVYPVGEPEQQHLPLWGMHKWLQDATKRRHGHDGHGEVDAIYELSHLLILMRGIHHYCYVESTKRHYDGLLTLLEAAEKFRKDKRGNKIVNR